MTSTTSGTDLSLTLWAVGVSLTVDEFSLSKTLGLPGRGVSGRERLNCRSHVCPRVPVPLVGLSVVRSVTVKGLNKTPFI